MLEDLMPEERVLIRVLGAELRDERDRLGLTQAEVVGRMPSGITWRTLQSYESGKRAMSVVRLMQVCAALGIDAAELLSRAALKAEAYVMLPLRIDLRALAKDPAVRFDLVRKWARNKLADSPSQTTARLEPPDVKTLSLVVGCPQPMLAAYLAGFLSDHTFGVDLELGRADKN